jgi:tellurite resistance protein
MDTQAQKEERRKMLNIIKENHDFAKFIHEVKDVMDKYWIWLGGQGKSLEEKNEQHYLSVCNNETTEYTVIDLEFQISTICDYSYKKPPCPSGRKRDEKKTSPRFDIIAVRNSDKRLCVIELKKGTGALTGKKSGVGDHADSFEGSIMRNKQSFIREIKKIVEDKKKLGLLSQTFDFKDDVVEFMYAYAFSDVNKTEEEKNYMRDIMRSNQCDYNVIYLDVNSYRLK